MSDPVFCWLKRGAGRPKISRDRVRVKFMMDAGLHDNLLELAGREGCSLTDMLNLLVAVGLPVLHFHPEFIQ